MGGYTSNRLFVVDLADGRRAFVKWAYSDDSNEWLRFEHRVYEALAGAPFMPKLLGWDDDGEHPLLAIEDLSDAHWPPPWRKGDIASVRAMLEEIAATPPPRGLPRAEEAIDPASDWERVRADPAPFLSLGLRDADWFERSFDMLLAATRSVRASGEALCHYDVRSDNLCLRDGRAILVDWNWACVGNPEIDLAAWAPSLYLEGGPPPWELLPGRPGYGAWLAGFWAARAGLPPLPGQNPVVRDLQKRQLAVVLEWAERELGLPAR